MSKRKFTWTEEIDRTTKQLQQFVKEVYKECKVRPGKLHCVVRYGSPVGRTIIAYAVERKAEFICIGTRGAGAIRRIIGTHTSAVIKYSPIPFFAIPGSYRRSPIKDIMYACDLHDISTELNKVRRFAESIKSKIHVLHYEYFVKIEDTRTAFEKVVLRYRSRNIDFHLQKFDWEESLAYHLKKAIRKLRPSIVVLFTKQDRTWYERLFFSSESVDVSYDTKKPLLVFPKV